MHMETGLFDVFSSFDGDGFVGLCVKQVNRLLYLVNVYSPCCPLGKRALWQGLLGLKNDLELGEWCIGGDFNDVVSRSE